MGQYATVYIYIYIYIYVSAQIPNVTNLLQNYSREQGEMYLPPVCPKTSISVPGVCGEKTDIKAGFPRGTSVYPCKFIISQTMHTHTPNCHYQGLL
jgi:hypothetical protein